MKYIRYLIYLYVLLGFSSSNAGSYDDFFLAVKLDQPYTVQKLLARGFDPNTPGPDGQTGLLIALRESSPKVAKLLLDDPKTQVEVRNAQDESPLMLAALRGYLDLCQALIARDADVNKPGWTPLHYAATGGHLQISKLLLEHSAYIDAAAPNGSTPLMMAAMFGTAEVVQLLLDSGADATLKNAAGDTALDYAVRGGRPDAQAMLGYPCESCKFRR